MIVDLTSGAVQRATGYVREGTTVRVQAPRTGHPTLIDFNADASGEVLASRTDVTATRQLTVEEIIARHRQQQATPGRRRRSLRSAWSGWNSTSVRR